MARIDFDGARIVCPTLDLRRVRRMRRTLTRSADDIRRGKRRVALVFSVPVELDVRLAATVELIDALARELVSAGEQLERWWQFMSELGASLAGRLASQIQGVVGHETRRRELADEGRRLGDPLLIRHAQLVERHLDETLRILGAVGLGLAYRLAAERRRITETKRALAARVEQLALTRERIGGHRQMLALIADVERSRHRARDTEAAFGQFESLIDVTLADFGRRLDELCMIDRDIEDVFLQCGRVYREVEVFATRAVGDATEDAEPIVEFDGLCATVDADSALHGLVASLGGAGSHTEEARFDLELLRTTSIRTSASALLAELERRLLNPPTGELKAGPAPTPGPPQPTDSGSDKAPPVEPRGPQEAFTQAAWHPIPARVPR